MFTAPHPSHTRVGSLLALGAVVAGVVIAAGDTFRAAAVEQLQIWGERAGVPVMTAAQGSDPASLAFDAMARAEAEGADLLLIDTAGRLQNREDLMAEQRSGAHPSLFVDAAEREQEPGHHRDEQQL